MSDDDWADHSPSQQRRMAEPPAGTPEGDLLAELRSQPGRWKRVFRDKGWGWWFTKEASVITRLSKKHLIEYDQDNVGASTRVDVWARALTPDERESSIEIEAQT